jgi:hypothetical protein
MKTNLSILAILFAVLFSASCQQDNKLKKQNAKSMATDSSFVDTATGATYKKVNELDMDERDKRPKTRITFEQINVELPEVVEGTQVKHSFSFKNTGNHPLIIYSAYGSCGCTVPEYSKDPVLPGEKGKINIVFDSNKRAGSNTKTVTVNANTFPPATTLKFTVKVNPK